MNIQQKPHQNVFDKQKLDAFTDQLQSKTFYLSFKTEYPTPLIIKAGI